VARRRARQPAVGAGRSPRRGLCGRATRQGTGATAPGGGHPLGLFSCFAGGCGCGSAIAQAWVAVVLEHVGRFARKETSVKIVKARIEKGSTTRFTDPHFGQGRVFGTFEDGSEELLFTYYLDELSFAP